MSTSVIQTAIKHFDDTIFGLLLIQHFFRTCLFLVSTDCAITTIPIPSLALVLKGLRTYWFYIAQKSYPPRQMTNTANILILKASGTFPSAWNAISLEDLSHY